LADAVRAIEVRNAGETMKFGRPWNIEGVHPRARETARAAARHSGMTVGEWLDSVIIEQAAEEGIAPLRFDSNDGESLAAINHRLDGLSRQLDRLAQRDDDASSLHQECGPTEIADAIARLERRLDQMIASGRLQASEIERRVTSVDRGLKNLGRARLQAAYVEPSTDAEQ
jgi:localization factor PodJL